MGALFQRPHPARDRSGHKSAVLVHGRHPDLYAIEPDALQQDLGGGNCGVRW